MTGDAQAMGSGTLVGQVALVTGANRGIGMATALALAERGAAVVAGVRRPEAAGELESALASVGAHFAVVPCDVASYTQVEAAVREALDRFGRLDALVNNAGVIEPIGTIDQVDPADWAAGVQVNLVGALHGCRAALPTMLKRGAGVIVNISSGAALRPLEGWSAYCAAKAGLAMLTRSLQLEMGSRGVRAYGLRPGLVDTGMQATIRASGVNEVSRVPRETMADPSAPARVVAWLCTPDAADLAGQELDIRDETLRRRAGLGAL